MTTPAREAQPFHDSVDHLRAELARLDVLLRHRLEAWWAETEAGADQFRDLYVSDEEVTRLLARRVDDGNTESGTAKDRADRSEELEAATADLRRRRRLPPVADDELRLDVLADRFGLDAAERDILLVALAPEVDPAYERIYGYLQDDITATRPTVDFALRLLSVAADPLRARGLLDGRSSLVRHRLVSLDHGHDRPRPARTLRVDDRIAAFVLGSDAVDDRLVGVETVRPTRTLDDLVLAEGVADRLSHLAAALDGENDDAPLAVFLSGPEGVGRDGAVEALCGSAELLVADLGSVTDVDSAWAARLVREATLRDAPLYVRGVEPDSDSWAGVGALLATLDGFDGPLYLSGTTPLPRPLRAALSNHDLVDCELPAPAYDRQRAYWASFELPGDVDSDTLAATFSLTPGRIDAVVGAARREARLTGESLSKELLYRCCRAETIDLLGTLARTVEPSYGWDDIVLPDDRLTRLREVAAHVKHRGTVYVDWGFERKFSLGNGLVVLFTGPSGTGKTMAAEIVAGDAGLTLYRIDLSSVVSKYIGETEKNLRRIFDEAEASNVVLLFDEADALFGKRSEVKDAHDRYANIEVDYLLQRLEAHDGTVILTTNFKRNIDDAFLRRIHLSVDFPMPDRDARAAIWESVFPAETPVEELDIAFLSGFELSGGNIKNVALTGAFLAADDGEAVGMRHVVRALAWELRKTGRVVRPDEFGRYRGVLAG